jgi:type II secretory pathway component GspD/PulD (secretin)
VEERAAAEQATRQQAAQVPPPVQQQQQVIQTATRPTTPPPAPRAATPRPLPRFDVTFVNEPLFEVIAHIGAYAGRSIIAAQDVRNRTISAEVRNQPWDLALEAILEANGLYAREVESSGVIIVEDVRNMANRRQSEPEVVRQFPIQYVSADTLRATVQGLLSNRGRVSVNSPANALIVTAPPSELAQLEVVLRELDVRPPQVNISATIAFIDRTALESFGVVYDLNDSRGHQLNRLVRDLGITDWRIRFSELDFRDAAATDHMIDQIFTTSGPLTDLVNNAAGNFISRTEDLSSRGFDAIANIVMHGTFYVTRAALRHMVSQGSGAIVNMGSRCGQEGQDSRRANRR